MATTVAAPARVFGSGIKRREDPRLLTGTARYTADMTLPGQLYAAILRSPHGHARIRKIDTAAAKASPGVVAAFTGADTEGVLQAIPCAWLVPNSDLKTAPYPAMAKSVVRYVGDAVAVVVAESPEQAADAVDLVDVDYEPLPATVDPEKAVKAGAPQLHQEAPNNVAFHWTVAGGDIDAAFKNADVVVRDRIIQQRLIPTAMETRGALAIYNVDAATGQLRPRGYVKTGASPVSAVSDVAQRFMFVLNQGAAQTPPNLLPILSAPSAVSVYIRDNVTGDLKEVSGSPYSISSTPAAAAHITLHPSGRFLYVVNTLGVDSIYGWSINQITGQLTPMVGGPWNTGANPSELVFDAGFGELFVVRVAGNVNSPEVMGTLQYAGAHLRTPLFVVLGHEGCGAVQAALAAKLQGTQERRHIAALLENILPGLRGVGARQAPRERLEAAVEANVRWSMRQVLDTPEGKARQAEGVMKLVGAVYELKSGRVRFLP